MTSPIVADPEAKQASSRPVLSATRTHNATVRGLVAAFDFVGAPGRSRYEIAVAMAAAIQALRLCSLAPSSIRLRTHQRDELIRSLKAAQIAIHVVFSDRMHPDDQLLNICGCGALILHWASGERLRVARPGHLDDADEIAAVFYHEMCSAALVERLAARTAALQESRAATFRDLLDVTGAAS